MSDFLKFGRDNAKLVNLLPFIPQYLKYLGIANIPAKPKLYTFSKLSGHFCPYARDCLSKAIKGIDGKMHIEDGPDTKFRCFSASQETLFPVVYAAREHNSNLILQRKKSGIDLALLINQSIPRDASIIRIHVGGDFINQLEFDGWINAALNYPHILFYAYTKSLPFWVKRLGEIPDNFVLTASYGGRKDDMIAKYGLRYSKVIFSTEGNKLPIDHDDSCAANPALRNKPFALLIHGVQPAGSEAGKAVRMLNGVGSYTR